MPHSLARLLANDHPLFTFNLHQLEQAVGGDAIDVKLLGDIMMRAHAVMRELGIDTADTTAEELYHALNATVGNAQAETLLADTHFVLLELDGQLVSFCLHDVIENAHHGLPFEKRKVDHAQRHLRAEIIERYAAHDRTDNALVHELAEQAGFKLKEDGDYKAVDEASTSNQTVSEGKKPSILMIGDIFTDAFIQLAEGSAKVIKEEDGKEWLALPFGQKPPYDHVDIVRSVGPSPNAAVSVARLGAYASLMAWIGGDDTGKEALAHLAEEHVDTDNMVTEPDNKTSYWYVLRYGADRTMLVRSEKYKYEWRDPSAKPDWIYLSYIGELAWPLHEALLDYLERNPEIKLAFQPGTFHFQWGAQKLAGIYGRSEIVVMNREEAVDVTGASYDNLHELAEALHRLGPKYVVITDGPNGSYASHDGKLMTIPNYPDPAPPLDRTGAGDAFASTIVAGLALGEDFGTALTWAPINSMSVVQQMGAQAGLLSLDKLKEWLAKAPEDYRASEL